MCALCFVCIMCIDLKGMNGFITIVILHSYSHHAAAVFLLLCCLVEIHHTECSYNTNKRLLLFMFSFKWTDT